MRFFSNLCLLGLAVIFEPSHTLAQAQCDRRYLEACRWWDRNDRTPEQKSFCECLDKMYPDNVAKPVTIEAANGAIYQADMNSIKWSDTGNAVLMTVYIKEGEGFSPGNIRTFKFDCRGYFQVIGSSISAPQFAPPKSIAGQISALACNSR